MQKSLTLSEKKKKFALALIATPDDPFKAALVVFGDDTGAALEAYPIWVKDPEVLQYQKEHLAVNEDAGLATKEDMSRAIYKIAENEKLETEDRLKAFRLYAETRGFLSKPATITGPVQINNTQQRIMIVKQRGENRKEWADQLRKQQLKLISDNG